MSGGKFLPVAVRAWTDQPRPARKPDQSNPPTRHVLVIDTETTTDTTQALTFGCYRYCHVDEHGRTITVAEGLFHADDLPQRDPAGYAILRAYADGHAADVDMLYTGCEPDWRLRLMSRAEFVEHWLWRVAYQRPAGRGWEPATVVMFNAPFDWSRLAGYVAEARRWFAGGFSLAPWTTDDGTPAPYRPCIGIKSIDSKRALKGFTQIEKGKRFRGHFLDLRTLVFALTGKSHSLAGACDAFGVKHGKLVAEQHGVITPEYIDYCRRDVQATTELYEKASVEYARHPINLPATQAYSPASIGKAYLEAMGITPILDRVPDFPADVLGHAMSAFYGGWAECHIGHVPVPVVVCDFTSMYPTVDALMNLWQLPVASCQ